MADPLREGKNMDDSDTIPVHLIVIDPERDKRYRPGGSDDQPLVTDND